MNRLTAFAGLGGAGIVGSLIGVTLTGEGTPHPGPAISESVRAKEFILVDDIGKQRMKLATARDGSP